MAVLNAKPESHGPGRPVFDRAHLAHYTMNSAELEKEIVGLFLQQLPSTIGMIEAANTPPAWKLATHTLKGSAAAVGAWQIEEIAAGLETLKVDNDVNVISLRMKSLAAAVADFRETVRQVYS